MVLKGVWTGVFMKMCYNLYIQCPFSREIQPILQPYKDSDDEALCPVFVSLVYIPHCSNDGTG